MDLIYRLVILGSCLILRLMVVMLVVACSSIRVLW